MKKKIFNIAFKIYLLKALNERCFSVRSFHGWQIDLKRKYMSIHLLMFLPMFLPYVQDGVSWIFYVLGRKNVPSWSSLNLLNVFMTVSICFYLWYSYYKSSVCDTHRVTVLQKILYLLTIYHQINGKFLAYSLPIICCSNPILKYGSWLSGLTVGPGVRKTCVQIPSQTLTICLPQLLQL